MLGRELPWESVFRASSAFKIPSYRYFPSLVKQSRPLSATFVAGGMGVVTTSTIYLLPPILYFGWALGMFLTIGCPLAIFEWNVRQEQKGEEEVGDLSRPEIGEIIDNPPTIKDDHVRVRGN